MPFRFLYPALFGLMMTSLFSWSGEGANASWTLQPFETEPSQLIAAVDEIKMGEGQNLKVLLQESTFSIDENHRTIESSRMVVQILNQQGLEDLSSISAAYTPWRQNKPQIRARVINPDGAVYQLDPAHLVDSNSEMENNIYSDFHTLSAPLPRLVIGSIVETEVVISDHTPLFGTGTNKELLLVSPIPIYCSRLLIDLPEKMDFKFKTSFMEGVTPIRKKQGDRISYQFELINAPEIEAFEENLPPDAPRFREVRFSTARSWKSLAAAYGQVIDQALVGESFQDVPQFKANGAHATAVTIMAWLNETIRYTGLELGVNSIIPFKPGETLKRGWGDCKDQATLMVGLLRRAGYKADVALLRVGDPTIDIDPDLPGLSLFNHAIVYLDEDGGHWYDPTSLFERDGYLPLPDQGVYALVANKKTSDLVRTSVSSSAENRIRQSVVYNLNDKGTGDIIYSKEYVSFHESEMRDYFSNLNEEEYEDYLKGVISSKFRSGTLGPYQRPDSKDLSKPLRYEFEAQEIGRALTEDSTGIVAIMRDTFSYDLNQYFEENTDAKNPESPRKSDFYFAIPFSYEVRSTIHLPKGFVLSKVLQDVVRPLGTMTYQMKVEKLDNGDLTILETLDSGRQRINAEEFEQTRKAAREFLKEDPILVEIEHLGQRLLNQGDYSGGMKVFRDAIAKDPEKAIHHQRFAKALSAAGFFMEAREEARLACEKAPNDAEAWTSLANLLILDPLGRQLYPGFDLDGALAAWNKALEIDPSRIRLIANCGTLLEHTPDGVRYGLNANLKAANDYFLRLDDESLKTFGQNIITNFLLLGEYAKALEQFERLKHLGLSDSYKFAALICLNGFEAVLPQMNQYQGKTSRVNLLAETGNRLFGAFKFKEGVACLRLAARGASNGSEINAFADVYQNVVKFEDIPPDFNNPRYVIQYLYKYLLSPKGENFTELRRITSPEFFSAALDSGAEGGLLGQFTSNYKLCKEKGYMPDQWACLKISTIQMEQSGNATNGFLVKGTLDGADFAYFLTPQQDGLRIIASAELSWLAGSQLLQLVADNRLDTARVWADWLRNSMENIDVSDPLTSIGTLKNIKSDSPEALTLIANCMISTGPDKEKVIPILKEEFARYKDHEWGPGIGYYLAISWSYAGHSEFEVNLARDFQAQFPDSIQANYILAMNLLCLEQHDQFLALLNDLRDRPALEGLHQLLSLEYMGPGNDYVGMKKSLLAASDATQLTADQYNELAWRALFEETLPEEALTFARKALSQAGGSPYGILHTLATLYAESGQNVEARQFLLQTIMAGPSLSIRSNEWYILGRIAEQYGLSESAIEAYNKVEKPELESNIPYSTWTLAQRALKRVNQAEPQ